MGYSKSPYDALMDEYEPGFTCEQAEELFDQLKEFLVPFIQAIKSSRVKIDSKFLSKKYSLKKQSEFVLFVIQKMGFDLDCGGLSETAHPFCQNLHPSDVRLSTRYDENDFVNQALLSAIHEAGHGLYEQGLKEEYFGTPLGEAVSLGIHESQSRLWEIQVGRSMYFWNYFYPKLKKLFPGNLKTKSFSSFYKAINHVSPGFIRCDADEVTYNLHVALRFEIERELIEGNLSVDELPSVWNRKMKEYFGLDVLDDAKGVLQDIHWSCGLFGYFPTYTLGNVYATQIFRAAQKQIPTLDYEIGMGRMLELREWLRMNIHIHGEMYLPEHLILRVTGEKPSAEYLIEHLKNKYSEIYEL